MLLLIENYHPYFLIDCHHKCDLRLTILRHSVNLRMLPKLRHVIKYLLNLLLVILDITLTLLIVL